MLRNACQYQTLVELLRVRMSDAPSKHAYTYLRDGETDALTWDYGELDRRARAIAAWLQSCGAAGERALLLYPPGLDYLAAFFGCLYAGVVAVPAYSSYFLVRTQKTVIVFFLTIKQTFIQRTRHLP